MRKKDLQERKLKDCLLIRTGRIPTMILHQISTTDINACLDSDGSYSVFPFFSIPPFGKVKLSFFRLKDCVNLLEEMERKNLLDMDKVCLQETLFTSRRLSCVSE